MCTRPRRAHASVGPSPSDDDSFRSGDERKRSPEVGGLADLPKGDSVASVRVGARSPTVATLPGPCWPRAGLSICKRFGDCRYCVAAEQLSGKGEHQRNCPKQNSADAQLRENQ
jgi:hypothetical protein